MSLVRGSVVPAKSQSCYHAARPFFKEFGEHMTWIFTPRLIFKVIASPEREDLVFFFFEPNASVARFVGAQTMYTYFFVVFCSFFRGVFTTSFLPEDSLLIPFRCTHKVKKRLPVKVHQWRSQNQCFRQRRHPSIRCHTARPWSARDNPPHGISSQFGDWR